MCRPMMTRYNLVASELFHVDLEFRNYPTLLISLVRDTGLDCLQTLNPDIVTLRWSLLSYILLIFVTESSHGRDSTRIDA